MKAVLGFFNTYVFGPMLPVFVFLIGTVLLIKYASFIFFKPMKMMSVFVKKEQGEGLSPFKSAMLALSGTLGVGNIVGVSTAIFAGGAGAVFWMTLSAFAAMSLKYGEVVLAVKHRKKENNEYRGGAMYYMRDHLKNSRLSVLFCLLCIINAFTVGNVLQVKAVSESFVSLFSLRPIHLGVIGAFVIFLSVCKGSGRISEISSRVIPIVTLAYVILSLYIICTNASGLPRVFSMIFKEAFSLKAAAGGVGGYTVGAAVRYGVSRGIMSNEAGSGTSPIAHAKSKLKSPVEQGFWGIFEVFADTVVMCNMTALVILLSFDELVVNKGLTGMGLVLASYGKYAGKWAEFLICISVLLFAYATVICQCFYGGECVYYLSKKKSVYRFYIIMFSLATVYGAVGGVDMIWELTDFNISLMTVINSICIFLASGEIKKETDAYFK